MSLKECKVQTTTNEIEILQQELPVVTNTIGNEQLPTVDARKLHAQLGIGKVFAAWINEQIEKYGFTEGEDYIEVVVSNSGKNLADKILNLGGRPARDYLLTLDTAKEIAMVQNNEAGRRIRKYLIRCHEALGKIVQQPQVETFLANRLLSLSDQMGQMMGILTKVVDKVYSTQSTTAHTQVTMPTIPEGFETLFQFAKENKLSRLASEYPAFAKFCAKRAKETGEPIVRVPSKRWGHVNAYSKPFMASSLLRFTAG